MGGTPCLALSIAAFPEELPMEMLAEIFAAAEQQVAGGGGLLAGGHTIRDAEPKYGLAVVGMVHPKGIWPKNGAKPGDTLFVTKPLGTGLVMTGYKRGQAGTQQLERAIRWMRNPEQRCRRRCCAGLEPNAVTDVTGLRPLWPHIRGRPTAVAVRIRLESERFPSDRRRTRRRAPGRAHQRRPADADFAGRHITLEGVPEAFVALGYDPQTAGGLASRSRAERAAALEAGVRGAEALHSPRSAGSKRASGVVVG